MIYKSIPAKNSASRIRTGSDLYDVMFDHYLFETYHHTDIFNELVNHIVDNLSSAKINEKIFTGYCCYMDKTGHRNVPVCVAGSEEDYHPIYYVLSDEILDIAEIDMDVDISEHTPVIIILNKHICEYCKFDFTIKSFIQHELIHGIQLITSDTENILKKPHRQLSLFSKIKQYYSPNGKDVFELDCSRLIDKDFENLMYLSCITEQNAVYNELYHYVKNRYENDSEWKERLLRISFNYKELVNNIIIDIDDDLFIRSSSMRLKKFDKEKFNDVIFQMLFAANAFKNTNLLREKDISSEDKDAYGLITTNNLINMHKLITSGISLTDETLEMFRPIYKYVHKLIHDRFDKFYDRCCGIIYDIVKDEIIRHNFKI